jgi:hypothetical protein
MAASKFDRRHRPDRPSSSVRPARDRDEQRPERFAVGEKVDARVTLRQDPQGQVSIKALEIAEEKEAVAQYGSSDSGASLGDILKGKVTKGMLRDLMQYSPQMVSSFIDLPRERYPLLQAIGALAKSQDDLAKSQEDLAKSQEDLAKSQEDLAKSQEDLAKSQEYLAKSQKMLEQAQAIAKAFGGKN